MYLLIIYISRIQTGALPCVPLQQQWLRGPVQVTASSWDSAPACCRANSAPVLSLREGCSPGTWTSQMKSILEVLDNYC